MCLRLFFLNAILLRFIISPREQTGSEKSRAGRVLR